MVFNGKFPVWSLPISPKKMSKPLNGSLTKSLYETYKDPRAVPGAEDGAWIVDTDERT
jgi:hypothetical protein